MGVRAGINEITPQAFDEMMAGGNPDVSGAKGYPLDKAWSDIHDMLQLAGYPLSRAIAGDVLHPSSQHSYEDFYEGEHDYYAGFVSIEMVKRIAEVLTEMQMPAVPAVSQWSEEDSYQYTEYVRSKFCALQKAYREAARNGNALMIVIA